MSQIIQKITSNTKKDEIVKMNKIFNQRNEILKNFNENFKLYEKMSNHRSLANQELVRMRRARKILKPMRIRSTSQSSLFHEDLEKDKSSEDLMLLKGNRLESPKLRLPDPNDKLWVASPIGQYEGIYIEENIKKDIGKSPDDMPEDFITKKKNLGYNGYYNFNIYQIKNKFNESEKGRDIPRTHQEIRECSLELTGDDLQKIQVGTKEINFGQIFINSEISKAFWIKNNLKTYIFLRLDIDQNFEELSRSKPLSHVIPPGETFGFKITIFSKNVKKIIYPVKYIINYKHIFHLKICADIIMAKLELQNSLNKFVFNYNKLDNEKVEMNVTQKIKLFNGGNAPVEINFEESKEKVFQIFPMKEKIPPNKEKEISISFNPFESEIQKEKYLDNIKMNIINGSPMFFPVEAQVPLVSVSFSNLEENTIYFELVHTGVPTSKFITLKNETPKNITIYKIENPLPDNLIFKEETGYILDKTKTIEIIFTHSEPNHNFMTEIPIMIRGGKKLILKLVANVVQPEVIIEEEKFDFGGVCFNEMKTKNLTLTNRSKLPASVYINLNSDLRYKDFRLLLNEKFKKDKHVLIPEQETNFDMVRKMNDAELAFFIVHRTGCDLCENFERMKDKNCTLSQCSEYWMKWGKSPATPIDLDNL